MSHHTSPHMRTEEQDGLIGTLDIQDIKDKKTGWANRILDIQI
jgi:hypothetical protein